MRTYQVPFDLVWAVRRAGHITHCLEFNSREGVELFASTPVRREPWQAREAALRDATFEAVLEFDGSHRLGPDAKGFDGGFNHALQVLEGEEGSCTTD